MEQIMNKNMPAQESQASAADKIQLAVDQIIYSKQTTGKIEEMLRSYPELAKAIAASAVLIIQILVKESGGKIPPEESERTIDLILGELGQLSSALGMPTSDDDIQSAKQMIMQGAQKAGQQPQTQPQAQPQPEQSQPAQPRGLLQMGA